MALDASSRGTAAERLGEIALEAGRLLRGLEGTTTDHQIKEDGTPTTAADLAAERLILRRLRETWPGIPVVAEETASDAVVGNLFFLVDPLDGTKDFLSGRGEYTVNIALVSGRRPVAAAVCAPAMGRAWRAGTIAETTRDGVIWSPIRTRPAPASGLVALVSRRHDDHESEECLRRLQVSERRAASSALKFCLIAQGDGDVYVRCGPTMEWDTAAGDHVLTCAGGCVVGPDGGPIHYGDHDARYRNRPFAAFGTPASAAGLCLPSSCQGWTS